MDWKQLGLVEKELVVYLKTKFPYPRYEDTMPNEFVARSMAQHAGREDVINALEAVISLQKKGR